ncbi:hypothetical protein Tco_0558951 [Tanacetum coccineum]
MVDGDKPPKDKAKASGSRESDIDQYDPLCFHGSSFSNNAKTIWDELEETYSKHDASRQYNSLVNLPDCICEKSDKLNKDNQLLKLMQFLMRLDEIYAPIRSIILTTDPIPDVKGTFATLSRDESYRGSQSHNLSKIALISEKSGSSCRASQHMTYTVLNMFNVVEVSKLNMIVGHPNGTKAVITHVGSLRLTDQIVIHDVLVVPGYEVSFLSMHKLRTGSESNGLYVLNTSKKLVNNMKVPVKLNGSLQPIKDDSQLGHPSDQVMNILKTKLDCETDKIDNVCDVCHKAKQTRDPFPLSEHQTKVLGWIVYLDVWGPHKVQSREGYKIPSSMLSGNSPYELVFSVEPNLSHLKLLVVCLSLLCLMTLKSSHIDKESENSEGIDPISSEGIENTGVTKRDEGEHPDDSELAKAISDIEENATLDENDKESEGDDSFYQEFNEMFKAPSVVPDSQNAFNPRRSSRKTMLDSGGNLYLTQRKYCLELLTEFGVLACKPCGTPIESKEGIMKPFKAIAKCKVTRKSVIGYVVFMGKNLVSWKSKKQSMLYKSSIEVVYRAMNNVTCEVIWILKVFTELNVDTSIPVPLHCDNSSTKQIAVNPVFHKRTKHFEIKLFFLREKVTDGVVKTVKIRSADNTSDIFTKGLSVIDHNSFCENLGMFDMYRIGLRGNIKNNKLIPHVRTYDETMLKSQG